MIWPFRTSKDRLIESQASEIAFLRAQFASARTIYKEPEVVQSRAVDSLSNIGLAELAAREAVNHRDERDQGVYAFNRNPIQSVEVPPEKEPEDE